MLGIQQKTRQFHVLVDTMSRSRVYKQTTEFQIVISVIKALEQVKGLAGDMKVLRPVFLKRVASQDLVLRSCV